MLILYRIRNRQNWKTRWPWRLMFPPKVKESLCRRCGLPFQDGPQPNPIRQFEDDCVAAIVYPAASFWSKKVTVCFGRWTRSSGQPRLSEYIPLEEVDSVLKVARQVQEQYQKNARRRASS